MTSRVDEPYGPELNTTCRWRNDTGAWFCRVTGRPHPRLPWQNLTVLSPLGMDNSTYFQVPSAPAGLFENGAKALKGHHWICGYRAYKALPANWTGVCYVGVIRPLFFLLSESGRLGVKPSDDLPRRKRSTEAGLPTPSSQRWGDAWPQLQRILETWKPKELISGAPEPIYNLNRIVRLQADLEILSGETARAPDALADPATQRHVVPNSHPAGGGSIWGTLNYSNCCLKIDDNGRVVQEIASRIRELAHVPVQTWESQESEPFSRLPGAPWVMRTLFYTLCAVAALLFLPCLVLGLIQFIRRVVTQRQPVAAS
ncbi:ENR1 protein, partial [Dromas ardeola]|nr:ENR1 protein [Dromas ardeola]